MQVLGGTAGGRGISGRASERAGAATAPSPRSYISGGACSFGIDVPDLLEWRNWKPGTEYRKDLVCKNVSTATIKIKFKQTASKAFSMGFPEPIKLRPGMSCPLQVRARIKLACVPALPSTAGAAQRAVQRGLAVLDSASSGSGRCWAAASHDGAACRRACAQVVFRPLKLQQYSDHIEIFVNDTASFIVLVEAYTPATAIQVRRSRSTRGPRALPGPPRRTQPPGTHAGGHNASGADARLLPHGKEAPCQLHGVADGRAAPAVAAVPARRLVAGLRRLGCSWRGRWLRRCRPASRSALCPARSCSSSR